MEHDAHASGAAHASGGAVDDAATAGWVLPSGLGDLPEELRQRAQALLGQQQRSIDALEQRMLVTGRHRAALDSIPARVAETGTAAYLDVTG